MAVAMTVNAGATATSSSSWAPSESPVTSNAGMTASATAAPRPTRSGPMRWALLPASGPEIAPNAAPIMSAAPMCHVGTPCECRWRGTSRSIAPSDTGSITERMMAASTRRLRRTLPMERT